MLNALGTSVVQIDSKDYKPEYPDKAIDLSSIHDNIHQTADLHKTLSLALGAILNIRILCHNKFRNFNSDRYTLSVLIWHS
jgi:hypothetical protein